MLSLFFISLLVISAISGWKENPHYDNYYNNILKTEHTVYVQINILPYDNYQVKMSCVSITITNRSTCWDTLIHEVNIFFLPHKQLKSKYPVTQNTAVKTRQLYATLTSGYVLTHCSSSSKISWVFPCSLMSKVRSSNLPNELLLVEFNNKTTEQREKAQLNHKQRGRPA